MTPLDINSAPESRLVLLRGVGPARAARILAGRPYRTTDELVSRGIISERLYDRIEAELTVSAASGHGDARSGSWTGSSRNAAISVPPTLGVAPLS